MRLGNASRSHAPVCFAVAALLAQVVALGGNTPGANGGAPLGSPSCALDCLWTHLVAAARATDGGDVYIPMHIPAATLVKIAIVQAQGGRFEQAAGTVARLADLPLRETARNRHRAEAYAGLAEALAAAGDAGGADRSFAQALAAADAAEPSAWIRSNIARALLRTQRADAAEDVLRRIEGAEYRALVIAAVAAAVAREGDVAAAHRMFASAFAAVAEETTGLSSRRKAFAAITTALVALGETAAARALIAAIESDLERLTALAVLAFAQAEAGTPAAAQETLWDAVAIAETFADGYDRATALVAIVTGGDTLAHDGPRDDRGVAGKSVALHLKTMAEGIADTRNRGFALAEVVGALARAGEVEAAFTAAAGIDTACGHAMALARVASEQAALGRVEDAAQTARRLAAVPTPSAVRGCGHYDAALAAIVKAQAKAGRFDAALAALESIEIAYERLDALAVVVEEWARHSPPPMPP